MGDDLMDQVADELLTAFQTKDKKMLIEALRALILHIEDEDENQDSEGMSP